MSLRDELEADSQRAPGVCSVCYWLTERPDPDDPEDDLAALMMVRNADGKFRYTHRAVYLAMKKLGYLSASTKPIERHRNDGHDPRRA